MIGGFGTAGLPSELIDALIGQGARDLTIVNNNAGNGDTGLAALLAAGRVRKIICSFPRQSDSWHFDKLYREGRIELELVPQGNLAERIRAAGAGIGGFFTPTGYGTDLAKGKETREIDGRMHVLESAHPCRRRPDQGRARRPLGQPDLPHDGTQLRPCHGHGRRSPWPRCTRWSNWAALDPRPWSRRGSSCSASSRSSAAAPPPAASRRLQHDAGRRDRSTKGRPMSRWTKDADGAPRGARHRRRHGGQPRHRHAHAGGEPHRARASR